MSKAGASETMQSDFFFPRRQFDHPLVQPGNRMQPTNVAFDPDPGEISPFCVIDLPFLKFGGLPTLKCAVSHVDSVLRLY